ncbi:MAG: protein-glutamate methylesterase [Deltaproteobacteria bacterium]|nr:protein-glutamate methylesterase [Deltaproteobacteria bacterium]
MKRPRVLVIDDSAFARMVLARLMRASGRIDVVAVARDVEEGLESIAALDPDVVTLDLTMPGTDGLAVLRALHGRSRPRVIVVSSSTIDTEIGAEALALGAIDLIAKPTALPSDQLFEIGDDLVAKVLAVADSEGATIPVTEPALADGKPVARAALVMIGTSTGGPQALSLLLASLPVTLASPIAIVLHIPEGYTEALARRLNKASPLDVVEAEDGMELRPGLAIVARGGLHLLIERDGLGLRARLGARTVRPFTPSVDELFSSGADAVGAGALGVVLTGMGDDGLAGARAIVAAGGSLLTESASTCVVYGMPRCVDEARLGACSIPIGGMAEEIIRRV